MRQLHTWHYMSAAVSLAGVLAFAITGFLLNHAASIGAHPVVASRTGQLAPSLLTMLKRPASGDAPLPSAVAQAVYQAVGLDPAGRPGEWSDADAYVALPRPGGDAWVSIDRATGRITSERTDQGWISYLNDLHKGRNTGAAWRWFIDIFAAACIVFAITGLVLLQFLARNRPFTWPLVGLGIAGPVLLAILFIH
ncbi:PepSY-associated TM helix domain-containing protein [Sphingomonas bacterium]|uniref:PepSY-associated TM helix domain-containing protein n=1 Tax=Sphingomonas bacterium TaxID=1895847 RepID=UPI0020C67955